MFNAEEDRACLGSFHNGGKKQISPPSLCPFRLFPYALVTQSLMLRLGK